MTLTYIVSAILATLIGWAVFKGVRKTLDGNAQMSAQWDNPTAVLAAVVTGVVTFLVLTAGIPRVLDRGINNMNDGFAGTTFERKFNSASETVASFLGTRDLINTGVSKTGDPAASGPVSAADMLGQKPTGGAEQKQSTAVPLVVIEVPTPTHLVRQVEEPVLEWARISGAAISATKTLSIDLIPKGIQCKVVKSRNNLIGADEWILECFSPENPSWKHAAIRITDEGRKSLRLGEGSVFTGTGQWPKGFFSLKPQSSLPQPTPVPQPTLVPAVVPALIMPTLPAAGGVVDDGSPAYACTWGLRRCAPHSNGYSYCWGKSAPDTPSGAYLGWYQGVPPGCSR